MNKIFALLMAASASGMCYASATPSRAYGIRIYSHSPQPTQELVSFSVDKPDVVKTEMQLEGLNIMAAAGYDGKYYMFHSDDGFLAYSLYCIDLERMQLSLVTEIDYKSNLTGNIILTEATYDPNYGMIIAAGYNLGEVSEDEVNAPFGFYLVDPATGEGTKMSTQNEVPFVALASTGGYFMYGIDSQSTIWNIDSETGELMFEYSNLGFEPIGLQSMEFDYGKNVAYYAGYCAGDAGNGESRLYRLFTDENYELQSELIGSVGNHDEIIGLYIDSDPANDAAPARVADFTATPGERGELSALLSWTNPSSTVGGETLQSLSINIYRDGELVNTIEGAAPGEPMTWTDTSLATGMHSYDVVALNDNGEGEHWLTDPVWYGVDTPAGPADLTAVKDAESNSITVTWSAPMVGNHGGWFDESQLTYTLVRQPGNVVLADATDATSYVDNATDELHGYIYEVTSSTAAGKGGTTVSKPVVAGNPLTVPYSTDFNDPDQVNQWTVVNADGDEYSWYAHTTGWAGTFDTFFRYYPENVVNPETEMNDWLISPAVTLEAGKLYVARYDLRLLGDLFPANLTLALGNAASPDAMTTILETLDGHINDIVWETRGVTFTVSESGTYHFGFQARNAVPVQFYNFKVFETAPVDMQAVSVNGGNLLTVGQEYFFEVGISNNGFNDVEKYAVELTDAEGNVLSSMEFDLPVPSQQSAVVTIGWTPTEEGAYEVFARVIAEGDEIADNNSCGSVKLNVLDDVVSVDVISPKTLPTGYAPLYLSYNNSAVQTIYTQEMTGVKGSLMIKGLIYYIYGFSGSEPLEFNLDVALANVDKTDFDDSEIIPESDLTKVFDGKVTLSPDSKTMTMIFDKPFKYEEGNLCVFTRHSSEGNANVMFNAAYSGSDPKHMALYRGEVPFDFTQEPNGFYCDLPDVSFLGSIDEVSVDKIGATSGVGIAYSRSARMLNITGDYEKCEIYGASGALLDSYEGMAEISLEGYPAGVAVVKVTTAEGVTTTKLAL